MLPPLGNRTGIDHRDRPSEYPAVRVGDTSRIFRSCREPGWRTAGAAAAAFYVSPLRVRLTHVSDTEPQWRHICEVCGVEEILTPGDAFNLGWDYPPRMGQFGVVGPRCCPNCPNVGTVWWALAIDGYTEYMLTEAQRATVRRIAGEPQSIAVLSE